MSSFIQHILIPSRKAGSAQHLRVRPLFLKISCASGTGRKPVQQVSAPLPTCSDKLTCYDQFCSVFLRGGKGVWSVIMLPRFSQWSFFFFFFLTLVTLPLQSLWLRRARALWALSLEQEQAQQRAVSISLAKDPWSWMHIRGLLAVRPIHQDGTEPILSCVTYAHCNTGTQQPWA